MHSVYSKLLEVFPRHFPSLLLLDVSIDGEQQSSYPGTGHHFSPSVARFYFLSLRHLYIDNMMITDLYSLVICCPNLNSLSATVQLTHSPSNCQALLNLSFCQLVLMQSSFSSLMKFLKGCNNLKRLVLGWLPVDDDGRMSMPWKMLIETYLPKLKHFDLYMISYDVPKNELEESSLYDFSSDRFWSERRTKGDYTQTRPASNNNQDLILNTKSSCRSRGKGNSMALVLTVHVHFLCSRMKASKKISCS